MGETWKHVPDFPDYLVSDAGNVRSLKFERDRLLKPKKNNKGYWNVGLYKNGKQTKCQIHQLVLLVFVGTVPDGEVTRHLNGIQTDNRLENLKYGTMKENMADRTLHGTVYNTNKTHCIRGHEFTEENTYVHKTKIGEVARNCITCSRINKLVRRSKIRGGEDIGNN